MDDTIIVAGKPFFELPPDELCPIGAEQNRPLTIRTNSIDEAIQFLKKAIDSPYAEGIIIMVDLPGQSNPGGFTGGGEQPEWLEPTICIGFNPVMGGRTGRKADPGPQQATISAEEMWRLTNHLRSHLLPPVFAPVRDWSFAENSADLLLEATAKMRSSLDLARIRVEDLAKALAKDEKQLKHHQLKGKKARNRVICNPKYC